MAVRITLDQMLAQRGMTAKYLTEQIGISETQISLFRSGKVRGLRFATLAKICFVLDCQPADLLAYTREESDMSTADVSHEQ
jgi:putative transcriptional regulator